jgi:phenylalanyl-tRNA synthetase beta chain
LKASYNWLREFVDFKLSPKELAHVLTRSGFEVEGLEEIGSDTVLDINVTPNRPDALSIIGIAREISAILEIPLRTSPIEIKKQEGRGPDVEIVDTQLCHRYASRLIHGVNPSPSPDWLVERLKVHGFRASLNIVDITNYVLLETGQPLHAFDLDKLAKQKIMVKAAGSETGFRTLDDEDRKLSKDMLLIWDADKPVALAGVMGGLNTEVSASTVNILLESAYFLPASVRRTSKSLGISSESSYRFERGVDKENIVRALDRAAKMIAEIAGGRISGLTDMHPVPFKNEEVPVKLEKINSLLGIKIEASFIKKVLGDLGFSIKVKSDGFTVIPPSFRQDVHNDVDIIEEIARRYGYEKIPVTLPCIKMQPAPVNKRQNIIRDIKNSMTRAGFSEVINYSFINPDTLDKLNIPLDDKRRKLVVVKNPLRKEESAMRTSLIPALLSNVSLNLNRGEKNISFFEVSKVFLSSDSKLPSEVIQMAAVYTSDKPAFWSAKHDGFYDIKGAAEDLFSDLKIGQYDLDQDMQLLEPYLHPGKSCSIIAGGERIGSIGDVHPKVLEAYDIKSNITVLELYDLEKLIEYVSPGTTFKPLPKYPHVERDIAIVVSNEVTVEQVKREISGFASDIIESVSLFDIYTGKQVPEGKKSLAFSIRYRAGDRTLIDEEVDSMHSVIVEKLKNTFKAELRS